MASCDTLFNNYSNSPISSMDWSPFSPTSMFQSTALRRFQSMPVPFCGFEDTTTPEVCHTRSKLQHTVSLGTNSPCCSPLKFASSKTSLTFGDDDFLDGCDETSQDSGVCVADGDLSQSLSADAACTGNKFRFAAPSGRAPGRRINSRVLSDETNNLLFSPGSNSSNSQRPFSLFNKGSESPVKLQRSSLTSSEDDEGDDDGFLELADVDDLCGTTSTAPSSMSGLFTKPLVATTSTNDVSMTFDDDTPLRRRAFSSVAADDQENQDPTPRAYSLSSKRGLFRSPSCPRNFQRKSVTFCGAQNAPAVSFPAVPNLRQSTATKRAEPDTNFCSGTTPVQTKRRKSVVEESPSVSAGSLPSPLATANGSSGGRRLQRCHSVALIESAMLKREQDENLVGDVSGSFSLPLCRSKHQDLKAINADTMAALIRGEYANEVDHVIVDARYPYEYEGGHFKGALNLWHKQAIIDKFMAPGATPISATPGKRTIIVFHCEFSSERGPRLCRFLRNKDRDANRDNYPELFYPELYLLESGYKNYFYNSDISLCEPSSYTPMDHADHCDDLRNFRSKSKALSNACEKSLSRKASGRMPFRPSLKL